MVGRRRFLTGLSAAALLAACGGAASPTAAPAKPTQAPARPTEAAAKPTAAATVAATVSAAPAATQPAAAATGEPVYFGVSGPFSGDNAEYGRDWKKGFALALD